MNILHILPAEGKNRKERGFIKGFMHENLSCGKG